MSKVVASDSLPIDAVRLPEEELEQHPMQHFPHVGPLPIA